MDILYGEFSKTDIYKAIYIYQAMTLPKDSVLWNGLP
jgi:hypothetical protein